MKITGIREARQNLSLLLEEIKKGREVLITDRGRPVAQLVRPRLLSARPFHSQRRFRATIKLRGKPLSETIIEEREDRL
jgi:prevent-host-death family protein